MIVTSMAQGKSVTQQRLQLATLNAGNLAPISGQAVHRLCYRTGAGQGQSGTGSSGTDRWRRCCEPRADVLPRSPRHRLLLYLLHSAAVCWSAVALLMPLIVEQPICNAPVYRCTASRTTITTSWCFLTFLLFLMTKTVDLLCRKRVMSPEVLKYLNEIHLKCKISFKLSRNFSVKHSRFCL